MSNSQIREVYGCYPIVAVYSINDYIFWGNYNYLIIYSIPLSRTVLRIKIFESSRINMIIGQSEEYESGKSSLCIIGGRDICLVDIDYSKMETEYTEISRIHHHHWIVFGVYIYKKILAFLTSHSELLIWDISVKDFINESPIDDSSESLIYSGQISLNESILSKDLWVITGSACGIIKIYCSLDISMENYDYKFKRIIELKGHKGPIFSIDISSDKKLLCSSSDDRSIILWDIDQRNILTQFYGHEARIWKVIFSSSQKSLLSIAEDGRCIHWGFDKQIISSYRSYVQGEGFWGIFLLKSLCSVILTSQSGRVIIFNYTSANAITQECIPVYENIKALVLDSFNHIYYATSNGDLYLKDSASKSPEIVYQNVSYQSYVALACNIDSKYVALGNINGEVTIIHILNHGIKPSTFKSFKPFNEKIISMFFADDVRFRSTLFYITNLYGYIKVYIIYSAMETLMAHHIISLDSKYDYPIMISSLRSRYSYKDGALYLLIAVGNNTGDVDLYEKQVTGDLLNCLLNGVSIVEDIPDKLPPICSFDKLHKNECCTCIYFLPDASVVCCGKDGAINILKQYSSSKYILHSKYNSCPKLEWLEDIISLPSYGLLVVGFYKQSKLVLYDIKNKCIMLKINCGGGHRQWGCNISETANHKLRVVTSYIKRPNVIFSVHEFDQHQLGHAIKAGYHSKVVRCCCLVFAGLNYSIIATAGEDRVINFWTFGLLEDSLTELTSVCDHSSSIFDMNVVELRRSIDSIDFILISVGGRYSICYYKLKHLLNTKDNTDIKTLFFVELTKEISSKFLSPADKRILDPSYIDLRATCIHSFVIYICSTEPVVQSIVGFSDGVIRTFLFDYHRNHVTLINQYNVHKGCLTTMLLLPGCENEIVKVLSASTAGEVVVLSVDLAKNASTYKAMENIKYNRSIFINSHFSCDLILTNFLHKWSINCSISSIAIYYTESVIRILCVGQSGSIYSFDSNDTSQSIVSWFGHSGCISKIIIVNETIVTVGSDRRIKTWRQSADLESIELVSEKWTNVNDPCCLFCIRPTKETNSAYLFISGTGVEILKLVT